MVTIKINGMPATAEEGSRLIDVIRNEGVEVPSLCYKPGMAHYTSCMVCVVRDNDTGRFIPSCSATVKDGMDIDASGPSVAEMRAEAVRLLLVEHRAECEAPCRLVCPKKLDIPKMNRLLTAGNIKEATQLVFNTLGDPVAVCTACKGYCDKACRRKKIDTNISIKNTVIFLGNQVAGAGRLVDGSGGKVTGSGLLIPASGLHVAGSGGKVDGSGKPVAASGDQIDGSGKPVAASGSQELPGFNSTLGAVSDEEFREWLKEARDGAANWTDPSTYEQASEEASRCLHCDCRAVTDCRLRDTAADLGVKNPRGKHTAHPIEKKINRVSGLIFEHAKCIKCGLCVRLSETLMGQPALCFKGRGFETIISEPLYHDFVDVLNESAGMFADICPTGALTLRNNEE